MPLFSESCSTAGPRTDDGNAGGVPPTIVSSSAGLQKEDSLEHYCKCPVVMQAAQVFIKIDYPAELAMDVWTLNNGLLDTEVGAVAVAILICGAYNAFNSIRHACIASRQQAYHCIVQHMNQAAAGHPRCTTFLDNRWKADAIHIC